MKFLIVALLLSCAVLVAHARPQNSDGDAAIIQQNAEVNPDGSYQYAYETANGIFGEERSIPDNEGAPKVQGQYQYTSPEGQVIRLVYEADSEGFHPQGEHLPVAPAIPDAILRALEWNAAHPEEDNL